MLKRINRGSVFLVLAGVIGAAILAKTLFPASPWGRALNWGLMATLLVLLASVAVFFEFESAAISSKEIALVAMLGTISAVMRVPFAPMPNIQPCTYLIICSGYVFGPLLGFMVGAITPLVSNFFLGQGPWTVYQMLAWGLAGLTAAYPRRFRAGFGVLLVFSILWGYIYGWIMNSWFWLSFIYPLTWRTFVLYQVHSIWFDTLHALANALFMAFLGRKTIRILTRFRKRFNWTRLA